MRELTLQQISLSYFGERFRGRFLVSDGLKDLPENEEELVDFFCHDSFTKLNDTKEVLLPRIGCILAILGILDIVIKLAFEEQEG